ncbi:hypothetical protein G5B37_01815 [Rasiella rasia]|uniref:Uncharacterized protein n=1 Tax=Rasiella rasia TaxID=2744027 RepID=A0A6G6GIH2_9FLAO|nr:hypothetical protein [Rasiella rasia]QIE58342.1 hypothetical protein G5B37_01815 [Rasiella rasia]
MKYVIYIALIVLSINTMNGQIDFGKKGYIITTDPSVVFQSGQNTRAFPWNGCHSFEATVDLKLIKITTEIMFCCIEGVCIPNPMPRSMSNNQEYGTLISSSTETVNGYKMSIVPGKYQISKEGRFLNLKFRISR